MSFITNGPILTGTIKKILVKSPKIDQVKLVQDAGDILEHSESLLLRNKENTEEKI